MIQSPLITTDALREFSNDQLIEEIEKERLASGRLRERERQAQLFFASARIGTWCWNIASGEVTGDAPMKRLYGLDPTSEPNISGYYELIHAEDREIVRKALEEALAGGSPYNAEFRVIQPDGSEHWIAARGSVQCGVDGRPVGMIGINFDVDVRKVADIALNESKRQFETLADSIPQLAWMADSDGSIFWYNARWYTYTGTTLEQMKGWGWQSVHDPEKLPEAMEKWRASIASGDAFEMEMPLRGQDGAFRWFLTRAIPVRDSLQEVVRWFGTNTDVTEAHRMQEALRENERQLQQLADSMPQLVCVTRPDGYVQWWNQRWYAYSGMTPEDAAGFGWTRVIHPEDREGTERKWLDALSTGDPIEAEYRWRRHDGTYRWFLSRALPVRDALGAIVKWFATYTDIEDYKLADGRVKILHASLEQRNENLVEQTLRAEEANTAKSEFLSAMSHEIRTPMNSILGIADLLSETPLNPEQSQYVEVFRRAGASLLAIINNVLDLSKIESGHFEIETIDFNLEDIVERSLELATLKASEKGLTLLARIDPDVPIHLIGDPTRFQQVLINLVGNALKFTEIGKIVLEVRRHASREPGRLEIAVSDSGIGIAPDKLRAIFEDFTQADASITRKHGGTGLGLGICRRLVECMGGQIEVESKLGVGSTFRFEACFGIGSSTQVAAQVNDFHIGKRVLVIESNEISRIIYRETLTAWGLFSIACSTASEGLAKLVESSHQGEPTSLVIIERQLSDMDGFEAVKKIQAAQFGVPIIMLTSDSRPGEATRCQEAGLAGYVLKPVKRTDLLRLVCDALRKSAHSSADVGQPREYSAGQQEDTKALRILIADDSSDNRMLLRAYLKYTSHTTTFVEDGMRAVEQFKSGNYDLILMDMQMPLLDGLGATRAIRRIEEEQGLTATPILALTASALTHDLSASAAAGCTAHLSKPISKQKLLAAIGHYNPSDVFMGAGAL
jgi:PAS domain S-box-containing protein